MAAAQNSHVHVCTLLIQNYAHFGQQDNKGSQWIQTSLRRLQDVLKRSRHLTTKQDVVTTSGKRPRIYDILKTCCLEDVKFTTSWRRLLYDVFRTSSLYRFYVLKTSDLQRLQDVWFTASWRRPTYAVLKTSVQLTMSWRRMIYDVLKTSVKQRLCSNVIATSIQCWKKWFFLILNCVKYSENFKFSSLG